MSAGASAVGRGLDLARGFYLEAVAPLLADVPHAAALLGDGSEVLGYDDEVSTDHDFGPRMQIFVDEGVDPGPVDELLTRGLPERFAGFPVAFSVPGMYGERSRHQVVVITASAFFQDLIGVDPVDGMGLADWLLTPTQRLATLTGGAVFHDPVGWLTARREALNWYPDDVWRYVLAAGWLRVGQENAFVGRTGMVGDELGSRVIAARLVRDLMRLAFLVERRWAPYSKWLGRGFADLHLASQVGGHLDAALRAGPWRAREAAVCEAGRILGDATNALDLASPVDTAPRPFYDRDIRILDAEGFSAALCDAIDDPDVAALLARLGRRAGTRIGRLPGAIDQSIDSTDVLTHPVRCRAAAGVLGLDGHGTGGTAVRGTT